MHSSGELGIQLATMLHLGAVLPNLTFAADAHYHHLVDDVIEGGNEIIANGAIAVPAGPGLGVELDREQRRALCRALSKPRRLSPTTATRPARLVRAGAQLPLG